jgi:two-component system, sensor histidine kinase and response regulator
MDKNILDLKDVLERVQDDRELLMELLDIFVEDYAEKREVLNDLIKEKNGEEVRNIAHSIKGAAGNISAKAIHATCQKMEALAELNDLGAVQSLLPQLDKQFVDLQGCIKELKG